MKFDCNLIDLGKIPYRKAYDLQKKAAEELKLGLSNEALIICEHPPVITIGRAGKLNNLLQDVISLYNEGIEFFKTDRGGDVTAHEPGQITLYPVLNLKARNQADIHLYLNNLQIVILELLTDFGLKAGLIQDKRGVWIRNRKIASIGIGISRWVTYHGLAINVNNNLKAFSYIRPCGMDVEVTSVSKELGYNVSLKLFKEKLISNFARVFNLNLKTENNTSNHHFGILRSSV